MANMRDTRYLEFVTDADLRTLTNGILAAVQTNLWRVVSIASSTVNATGRKVVLATSHTDHNIVGVLQEVKNAGEPVAVLGRNAYGTGKVVVGTNSAAVSIGDYLTVDTDSGALKTTTASDEIIGRAMEAGVAGQVIEYMPVNYLHF